MVAFPRGRPRSTARVRPAAVAQGQAGAAGAILLPHAPLPRPRFQHAEPHARSSSRSTTPCAASSSRTRCRSTRRFPSTARSTACCRERDPAVAVSPPLLWAEALDPMMARVAKSGARPRPHRGDFRIGAAARQRLPERAGRGGARRARSRRSRWSTRWRRCCRARWRRSGWTRAPAPNAARSPRPSAATRVARAAHRLARVRALHRTADPEFSKHDPAAYAATDRIHLVSSFLASLLAGRHAPIDPGDGSGMNLMDLACGHVVARRRVEATAPDLAAQASADRRGIDRSSARSRRTGSERYGFPAANVIAGRATTRAA